MSSNQCNNKEEFNGFDAISGLPDPKEVEKLKLEGEVERNKMAYLLHQVFVQNVLGRELMNQWKERLITAPSFDGNSSQFDAGLNEGEKRFVRDILLLINNKISRTNLFSPSFNPASNCEELPSKEGAVISLSFH